MGYVGSVTAAKLAASGHDVIGVDLDPSKVASIERGRPPVTEPGLDDLMLKAWAAGRLRATSSVKAALERAELALICVGTPTGAAGGPDLGALERVGVEIGAALGNRRDCAVVLRSTVLPGTTEGELAAALAAGAPDHDFRAPLAFVPEFMREGAALRDFTSPPFSLLGCSDAETDQKLRRLFIDVDAPFVAATIRVAETVKYAANAYHALKICFANEIGALCAARGVDGDEVMRIFRLDRKLNVSDAYLRPGFAFGGSCLGKDVRALAYAAEAGGVVLPIITSMLPSNDAHVNRAVAAILRTGERKVGVLGLAFKPGTDDVRESPLVTLVTRLQEAGCEVRVYDRVLKQANLIGRNREFLETHIHDFGKVLCSDVRELAAHARTLVLGHDGPDADQARSLARHGCEVIDLTRGTPPVPVEDVEAKRGDGGARGTVMRRLLGLLCLGTALGCSSVAPFAPTDAGTAAGVPPPMAAPSYAAAAPSDVRSVELPPPGLGSGPRRTLAEDADLQRALDDARPGDVLVLASGASYVGPFVLPQKVGDGWITIAGPTERARGVRVAPAQAGAMPKLSAAAGAVLSAAPGAHHYRFVGLEIRPTPGAFLHNLVVLGDARMAADAVPHHLSFEGCYLHGDPAAGTRRGVAMNSAHTAVIDSYLADFKEQGADSQAIAGWAGPGPFLIENDYLEAAGENVMFGGADAPDATRIPADIVVRGNHFSKPLAWKRGETGYGGERWSVKNLFELKTARRVFVADNLLEHNWPDSQNGFAILFTVRNQEGGAPWSTVEDVTFRGNIVRGTASAVNVLGRDDARGGDSGRAQRILVRDNLFLDIGGARWGGGGTLFQLLEGTRDVVIEHNTAFHAGNVITADGARHEGFAFRDNVVAVNRYGIFGSGAGTGTSALAAFFPGADVRRNVLAGGRAEDYPADNFFPASLDAVVRVEANGTVALVADGFRRVGTDGKDLGADPAALVAAARAGAGGESAP
ncbi:MAG: nucleotide sugar dehydrogenase [Polyangiaceae bacterium]|nr:nucleotide sugar dehydrogenase [Polyangiaceae bacterium]